MDLLGRIGMVDNGYISFFTETGGGQDADGNPVAAVKTESDSVPCNLLVVTKEYKIYENGQYRNAKYSIYVDNSRIPDTIDIASVKEVRIKDNKQNDLGIHQIQNPEYLAIMNQTKIVV